MTSLADDVARLRQVLSCQSGPTIVAGHSYGGQIMTALGADAPNVVGLVYIAAFGLDEGESLGALLCAGARRPRRWRTSFIDEQGFAWLPEDDFVNHFAADVDPSRREVMYAVQQPLVDDRVRGRDGRAGVEVAAVRGTSSRQNDEAIPPDAERHVRAADGRDHRRGRVEPRRDGLPSRRGRRPGREGGRGGRRDSRALMSAKEASR